ncbi:MAG: hypothetical protein IRY99_27390 [Isosphaeraceae bacterium]|nr:hypothetical protein [Isosphaeraceae bacterium]
MPHLCTVGLVLLAMGPTEEPEPEHARNPVYTAVLTEGLTVGGATIRPPGPTFRDGQSADEQRAALRALAGSERAVGELLRDSVSAPFLLKLHDEKAEGATLRAGDLYFILHVELDTIDPAELFRTTERGSVEAGNMRFEVRWLGADDLRGGPAEVPGRAEWYVHTTGRLLDRIAVEATSHLTSSRSADSIVVAARTDRRFDDDDRWPNRWRPLERRRDSERPGPAHAYTGGIGYTKISRLRGVPKAVIVEAHFAFAEPRAWFDGAPILRSKLSLIAQDQIRRLRRELAGEPKGR